MTTQTDEVWLVQTSGGERVCVPADLDAMTTYVLLERRDWFEDEINFARALAPHLAQAFDIGANHGVYTLALAQANPSLEVHAFEPTVAGQRLAHALVANGFQDRCHVYHHALAADETEISFSAGMHTELAGKSEVSPANSTQRVHAYPLDALIDAGALALSQGLLFVKLDVESMEEEVIRGAQRLFRDASPLIMFERLHQGVINASLPAVLQTLGYRLYRLVPGLQRLIPWSEQDVHPYQLNLFAAKPDTAVRLAELGLLVAESATNITLTAAAERTLRALQGWAYTHHTRRWPFDLAHAHDRALALWVAAQDEALPPPVRLAALAQAWQTASELPQEALATQFLRVRIALDWGQRSAAIALAQGLIAQIQRGHQPERFFPPLLAEYAAVAPGDQWQPWLLAQLLEFLLRYRGWSTFFTGVHTAELQAILAYPRHSPWAERVALLTGARLLNPPRISPASSLFDRGREPNAEIFRHLAFGALADVLLRGEGRRGEERRGEERRGEEKGSW